MSPRPQETPCTPQRLTRPTEILPRHPCRSFHRPANAHGVNDLSVLGFTSSLHQTSLLPSQTTPTRPRIQLASPHLGIPDAIDVPGCAPVSIFFLFFLFLCGFFFEVVEGLGIQVKDASDQLFGLRAAPGKSTRPKCSI